MAVKKCKVAGCSRAVKAVGFCYPHYHRNRRYGNPLAGHAFQGLRKKWIHENCQTQETECILWPLGLNWQNYPRHVRHKGKNCPGHRYMCIQAHGEPPDDGMHAAHSCGNSWCINPNHLRWATQIENERDKISHGTLLMGEMQWKSKLTEQAVRHIRSCNTRPAVLAEKYNVTSSAIRNCRNRITWKHIP